MDNWFIPGLAMSIIFVVLYQAYHFLVMPSLLQSLVLLVIALIVMFGLVIIVYVDYFQVNSFSSKKHLVQSFSQFITRTSGGHSIMILILLLILLLNGIVNSVGTIAGLPANIFEREHENRLQLWGLTK